MKTPFDRVMEFDWKGAAQKLVYETPIEIPALAIVLCTVFSTVSYHHEDAKKGQMPLAFSEIGQTKRVMGWHKMKVPPLTMHYSVANDVPMMAFEANNLGYKWGWKGQTERFAYELEKKIDPGLRIHTLISDYAPQMKQIGDEAMTSLKKIDDADKDLPALIDALDRSWDEEHDDQFRTEYYQEEVCTTSSDGKSQSCHSETRSREVYDHTDHYYWYRDKYGQLAVKLLAEFKIKHPDVNIDEALMLAPQTNAENEWAMRESRVKQREKKELTQDNYIQLANVWATRSNYHLLMPSIIKEKTRLDGSVNEWSVARKTSRNFSYQTYSHSDSGPAQYQVVESALKQAVDMSDNISTITDGVKFAQRNIPILSQKSQQLVNVALHGEKGDANKLRKEVLDLARQIYAMNFSGGFDTSPSKWGMVFLWGFLGAASGGGLGYGLNALLDQSRGAKEYYERQKKAAFSRPFEPGNF